MSIPQMILMVFAMAAVTYVIRMIPMVFFRKKIKSKYLYSLFYYIPYAVLSAMTFPFVFFATESVIAAVVGTIVALVAAFSKRSLIVVALLACVAVFAVEFLIVFI